jgi:beta-phosphoglucomutase family hydrolase
MARSEPKPVITREAYDAVLLDLDGVITDTATLHEASWKRTFDTYLGRRAAQSGEPFQPFDHADYRLYVDGKPRSDGVRDFLASRSISLPEGTVDDPPEAETVGGLGNRKNALLNAVIAEEGVQPYPGSVALIHWLREKGFKLAVVTSSRNCAVVLKAARLDTLFDAQVDGNTIAARHLAGKPAPDAFLAATELLGCAPARAVVVEDAISGVEAGRNGGFGLVIGVARRGDAAELTRSGADAVVDDLSELIAPCPGAAEGPVP